MLRERKKRRFFRERKNREMDGERQSPSSSAPYIGGDMGAGGKFRKPPLRKKPGTPYDRPPTASNQPPPQRRWLSMLVDPACRLIAGSATKILPSFFSRSSSTSDLSSSDNDDLGKSLSLSHTHTHI